MIFPEFTNYVTQIKKSLNNQFSLAQQARNRKYDPRCNVESIITYSVKLRISSIINIAGLEENLPSNIVFHENSLLLAAEIAKQIVNGYYLKLPREELILIALQSACVILSQGLISVPEEAIPKIAISEKTSHLTIFFSNTIRYVPGEVIGLVVLIADYLRRILHLNRFNATPEMIGRYIEELELYYELSDRIPDLKKDLAKLILQNIGIEISGESYERIEVVKYRNLPPLSNQLRMGMCVALERFMDNINLITRYKILAEIPEWNWLDRSFHFVKKNKLVFGDREIRGTQPLLSKSSGPGGFQLRYGRTRNTGFGSVGVNPATMMLLKIISPGTSIKIDLIERNLITLPVSSLTGPLVTIEDGSLVRIDNIETFKEYENRIIQIWELGELLLCPDDIPDQEAFDISSWTEEWWAMEVINASIRKFGSIQNLARALSVDFNILKSCLDNPSVFKLNPEKVYLISKLTKVPLHPKFSFNWNNIAISDLILLLDHIIKNEEPKIPNNDEMKRILSFLGVPFSVSNERIEFDNFQHILTRLKDENLDLDQIINNLSIEDETEEIVSKLIGVPIRSKSKRRLGTQIVRVEKAEPRHINPPSHVLFPIGSLGGSQRNLLKVIKEKAVILNLSNRYCSSCQKTVYYVYCPDCNQETTQKLLCRNNHTFETKNCPVCGNYGVPSKPHSVAFEELLKVNKSDISNLEKFKAVSYLNTKNKIPENLNKGVLRARHDIYVYKDGTSRFDTTNAPLLCFKPLEVGTSIEDLIRLGYDHDIEGKQLENENQLIELFPYDVIISKSSEKFLLKLTKFIDDELTEFYDLPAYFRLKSFQDLMGSLIVGISPFSKVGVIGRIIGSTTTDVLYAHPVWHKLKGRNCNGDIDSFTLLLDVLINFSEEFIPTTRGGTMDVPMVLNMPDSWEDLSFYAMSESIPMNLLFFRELKSNPTKKDLLVYKISNLNYSYPKIHKIDNISGFNISNPLKQSKLISKIQSSLSILKKIQGTQESEFVEKILENDFLEKYNSSLEKFFSQPFRCLRCNRNFRRIPLSGKCSSCGQEKIGLTLSEGWVLRYTQIITQLEENYASSISQYLDSWIKLLEINKRQVFEIGLRPTTLF